MAEARAPNPLVDQFRRGGIPKDLRLMAAQGALPLKPADLVELLHFLLSDSDEEVRQAAAATLAGFPVEELLPHRQGPRDAAPGAGLGPREPRGARAARGRPPEHVDRRRGDRGRRPRPAHGAGRAGRHQPDAPAAQHVAARGHRVEPGPEQRPEAPPSRAARDLPHRGRAAEAPPAAAPAASRRPPSRSPSPVEAAGGPSPTARPSPAT